MATTADQIAKLRRRLDGLADRLRDHRAELESLRSTLPMLTRTAAEDRAAERHRARSSLARAHRRGVREVGEHRDTVRAAATDQIAAAVRELAPGPLSAPWDAPLWHEPAGGTQTFGTHVRVGSVDYGTGAQPVVLPLLGTAGWRVDSDEPQFAALVRSTLLRLLAALGPSGLDFVSFDPTMSVGIGAFGGLRQATTPGGQVTLPTPEAFAVEVERLLVDVSRVGDDLAGQGFSSLIDVGQVRGHAGHPFQLMVINGDLADLSDAARSRLRQLITSGGPRGVSTLIRRNATASQSSLDAEIAGRLLPIQVDREAASSPVLPGVRWRADTAPPQALVNAVVEQVLSAPQRSLETPSLPELVDELTDRWLEPGDTGVRALIGRTEGRPLYLELRSENPPMPNALIGGAVGQGKSNLLLVLIHMLAAQYAPTDLEMVLLDFRDGVEFATLGPRPEEPSWLPHAVVLGLECDRDFGLAVLEEMTAELSRRTALFKAAGVGKINDYRTRTGRQMPRRLLIIDEFQRLLDGDDPTAERCARLLDDLARTGRAAGFHIVLASQTISGIRGLAARADAIFSQFHHRISLRNTAAESTAILGPRNTAAAHLVHRGEMVVNSQLGDPEANRRAVVAHAEAGTLTRLRRELWLSAPPDRPPTTFRRSEYALWTPAVERAARGGGDRTLVVGAPISVAEVARPFTFGTGGDQAVAVVGTDPSLVAATLSAMSLGWLLSTPAARIDILDALSRPDAPDPMATRLIHALSAVIGAPIIHLSGEQVLRRLGEVARPGDFTGEARLLIALGLDALRHLDAPDPGTFRTPVDSLREIAQHGPASGTWLVGWWRARRAVEQQLGFGAPGVRAWALCGVGKDDTEAVCGPLISPPSGHPRILWYDREKPRPEVLVPYAVKTGGDAR